MSKASISIMLKSWRAELLYRTGILPRYFKNKSNSGYFILMYHRVINPTACRQYLQPGMYVTPDTFKMHLNFLLKSVHILPLHSLINNIKSDSLPQNSKPTCAITFDDGWQDFYSNAWPLLRDKNIPATVYLPVNFINTNKQFWTDRFASIWKNKKVSCNNSCHQVIKEMFQLRGSFSQQVEKGIEQLKILPLHTIDSILNELETLSGLNHYGEERSFLSWKEVEELYKSELITFGSHTVNHQILTTLDIESIHRELVVSYDMLKRNKVADSTTRSFCYPNGNWNEDIAKQVEEAGYSFAVTTKNGWNSLSDNLFTLKRIGVHNDMSSSEAMFASLLAR